MFKQFVQIVFTDYLKRGDEEKDEMQGAMGISTPEQPYGCEDLKFTCNEADRVLGAPLFKEFIDIPYSLRQGEDHDAVIFLNLSASNSDE